ncbi:MAG: adenosylhomocysteinase [Candidatus Omnitrophica bacterium]|jgi:adenosylhomocysteinase|nr:adenosylhomocysteinase [Candidatus Omnitrophota bacterium]
MEYFIKDINLADEGKRKILWAGKEMPVLDILKQTQAKNLFSGTTIGACLHVTSETANLVIALSECGANVFLTASNPLSTQDEVAASLVKNYNIPVFAKKGENESEYNHNIRIIAEKKPHIIIDDGADLIAYMHQNYSLAENILGATEETTTGITRIKSLEKDKKLTFPVIAVNDAMTKHLFDNRYGTGQSTIDGILRATNILIAGKIIVVCGYGWCGKGISKNFRGLGAKVIVVEVDPIKALEAVMDGFYVMKIEKAAETGDIFVTSTGDRDVISADVLTKIKDGAIIANSGHFNVEIDVDYLEKNAKEKNHIKPMVIEYVLKNNKKVYLLAEGRLVNLGCAEGHPSSVMDLSFSNQFMASKYLKENKGLQSKLYSVPEEIDRKIAELKLKSLNIEIDTLTEKQKEYLSSWEL